MSALLQPTVLEVSSSDATNLSLPVWAQLTLFVLLICLSATFAGLTIGIMGLDTISLEIIAEAGPEPDSTYARKLLPVRKLGHFALSTLILGNMWADVMIAQFCVDISPEGGGDSSSSASGLIGFLLSTFIILLFGEILPASICKSENALRVAAAGVPLLNCALVLLYPVARPMGWLLDHLVKHDVGQIYSRNELIKLMSLHAERLGATSGLDRDEGTILVGALEFKEKRVLDIMVPISDTFCVAENVLVDRALVHLLWAKGKSRVPVVRGRACRQTAESVSGETALSDNEKQDIVGILHVKSLLTFDFRGTNSQDPSTVGQYLKRQQHRELCHVTTNDTLPKLMALARTGVSHLFIVHEIMVGAGSNMGNVVGICTMDNILEAITMKKIEDYNGVNMSWIGQSDSDDLPGAPMKSCEYVPINFFTFETSLAARLHGETIVSLSRVEIAAIARYLLFAVPAFSFWKKRLIAHLVSEATVEQISEESVSKNTTSMLCQMGEPLTDFILILSGIVDISFGSHSSFETQFGPMRFVGEITLLDRKISHMATYTAKVSKTPVWLLRISTALYDKHESKTKSFSSAPQCPFVAEKSMQTEELRED